ncbi:MAG: hypothetical protein ACXWQZ_24185 [Ktedonobacterales bacterium]
MRLLVRLVAGKMLESQIGRWVLTSVLLVFGVFCLIGYGSIQTGREVATSANEELSLLIGGIICVALGIVVLVYTARIGRAHRGVREIADQRVKELQATGQLLPIPPLPAKVAGVSGEDARRVEQYARDMAATAWGEYVRITGPEVRQTFDRAVAQVRRVTGDWSKFDGPIATFAAMPKPYCYIGAAEIMLRLAFLRNRTWAPVGLRQGLRFLARAQYHEPFQPDLLVIRTKLLAGCADSRWLSLAEQTLAILKRVAPEHPRIPNAEQLIFEQRGRIEDAIACTDRTLAHPPSPEEAYIALSNKALLLQQLKRYEESLAIYGQLASLAPNDPWMWHNQSLMLYNLGRYAEALQCNDRALALMQFGVAHDFRQKILDALAGAGTTVGKGL